MPGLYHRSSDNYPYGVDVPGVQGVVQALGFRVSGFRGYSGFRV